MFSLNISNGDAYQTMRFCRMMFYMTSFSLYEIDRNRTNQNKKKGTINLRRLAETNLLVELRKLVECRFLRNERDVCLLQQCAFRLLRSTLRFLDVIKRRHHIITGLLQLRRLVAFLLLCIRSFFRYLSDHTQRTRSVVSVTRPKCCSCDIRPRVASRSSTRSDAP